MFDDALIAGGLPSFVTFRHVTANMKANGKMRIGVIGAGYVGLVTGLCLANFNHSVTFIDTDKKKITKLRNCELPIYEPGLEGILRRVNQRGRIVFADEFSSVGSGFDLIFVAVGTPAAADGSADLAPLLSAIDSVAQRLRQATVVAIKSTVPVGTAALVARRIRGINPTARFDLVSNPEFLREGSAVADFLKPDRIVVGADSPDAAQLMRRVYLPLVRKGTPLLVTSIATAELIKYAANGFLATKVAYINEMASLCEALGADVEDLSQAIGLDPRIGPAFLRPGPGFGGSCFPKDIQALVAQAQEADCPIRIIEAVIAANAHQVRRQIHRIEAICRTSWRALGRLDFGFDGKAVALLGLAFKSNTDDVRCSPGMKLAQQLCERRASVRVYDPKAMPQARAVAPGLDYCRSAEEALMGADCAIIATEWPQFADLNWRDLKPLMDAPVVIDLRNLLSPERMHSWGFVYEPLGHSGRRLGDRELVDRATEPATLATVSLGRSAVLE